MPLLLAPLLALLAAALVPSAAADPALPTLVPVFTAGTHGHACYRVPSAIQAPSGALLVFVEARGASCQDNTPKDVMLARSADGGASWSPPRMVLAGFAAGQTYRNPTAVIARSGALVLQFVNSTRDPWRSLQMVSLDEGATWGPPLDPQLGAADSFLAGPANGLRLSARSAAPGRLLLCGTHIDDPGARPPPGARVWLSDDASGAPGTWASPPGALAPRMGECAMAELRNGSVLMNFRANHLRPCNCRAQSRSDDGGATWTPLADAPELVEPVCSAGLLALAGGAELLFSNPASATSRVNMTVRRSSDGGSTWPARAQIWPGGSAYSVLLPVGSSGAAAGIVFETMEGSNYTGIVFALVPPL